MNHDPRPPHGGTPAPAPATPSPSASPAAAPGRRWTLDDFDYALPPELIAQHPAPERSGSRLLDGTGALPVDRAIRDLPALLQPGDLLVSNDTQVIKARLLGAKASGGAVEALVERVLTGLHDAQGAPRHEVWAHLRASKSPKPGTVIRFAEAFDAEVIGRAGPDGALFHLRFPADPFALLARHGHVPLPPYIVHDDTAEDEARYQTVFAAKPGAVAAPTAALHFDAALLQAIETRGVRQARVTLHVGAGTFLPVRVDDIAQHRMHSEWYEVPAATAQAVAETRAAGGRVLAVGTTTLRALESAALRPRPDAPAGAGTGIAGAARPVVQPGAGETDLFVTPGFTFRAADLLLTNFHLPRSTLMMLVSAFAGHAHVMALYRHAVESRYRFFSYGDAMLLARG